MGQLGLAQSTANVDEAEGNKECEYEWQIWARGPYYYTQWVKMDEQSEIWQHGTINKNHNKIL